MAGEEPSTAQLMAELEALRVENARLRAQLEQDAVELQQLHASNAIKDQFVSRVGHDLRTPLANIKLYAELLKKGRPEKREEYQQVLMQQAARLQKLLDDLLDISRLDMGKIEFHFDHIDLNALLTELSAGYRTSAAARRQQLTLELASGLPHARADPALLKQAVSRLLKNALDYTPPEGYILCRTALHHTGGQPWITLAVENSGLGLDAGEIEHVGERFFRGHAARQYKVEGSGLGLAICREIVVRHGGRLTVDSKQGSYAIFTIWLKPAETTAPF